MHSKYIDNSDVYEIENIQYDNIVGIDHTNVYKDACKENKVFKGERSGRAD